MVDESSQDSNAARMRLGPKAIHEDDGGYALDGPECGSRVSSVRIVEEGRCDGYLEGGNVEAVDDDGRQLKEPQCGAELVLDLAWR